MTDARYPETWLNDRRILRLSDAGHRLFVVAMAWSASNRTDGVLEPDDLLLMHRVDPQYAVELVNGGLWQNHGYGWLIVDFVRTQSSKAQLDGMDHKRHLDRERQARKRARDRGEPDPDPDSEPLSRDVTGVTTGVTSTVTQRQGKDRTGRQGEADRSASGDPWVTDGKGVVVGAASAAATAAPLTKRCRECGGPLFGPMSIAEGVCADCSNRMEKTA